MTLSMLVVCIQDSAKVVLELGLLLPSKIWVKDD